jgi:predicted LPLAT superfamily acyltransferase
MQRFFFHCVVFLSKKLGLWIFITYAWTVATGFFLFFPYRVANSVRFYRILFPERNGFYHLWCAWRQFHNFTDVFLDRFLLQDFDNIRITSEGLDYLKQTIEKGKGGILLMSHMGNWEMAAHLLMREFNQIRLLLYMGVKQKEQIEQLQKEGLSNRGIRIIAVDQEGGSPLDIVEGIRFIQTGGFVSLTGDLLWRKAQRRLAVTFLGHEVYLPETPHLFALLAGAPLFIFFAFRKGKNRYHFTISTPIRLSASIRAERAAVIHQSAQKYADILQEYLRLYPLQWYHFEPFLDSKLK